MQHEEYAADMRAVSHLRNKPGESGPDGNQPGDMSPRTKAAVVICAAVAGVFALLLLSLVFHHDSTPSPKAVSINEGLAQIDSHHVKRAHLDDWKRDATLQTRNGAIEFSYPEQYGATLVDKLRAAHVTTEISSAPSTGSPTSKVLGILLPIGLIAGLFFAMRRMRHRPPVSTSAAQKGPAAVPETKFSDVAGADEAVAEVAEIAEFLRERQRFKSAGARLPKGVLLVGPPGTGKTLLARAIAGEAGVPFFPIAGSEFSEMYVGVGAARARSLFEKARAAAPAIVFIDEIDAVGKRRAGHTIAGGEERENTLNQLLVEMDGFSESNVIVIGATNRADVLDHALTRPGRFDRQVQVPLPDRKGRTEILELHARDKRLASGVDCVAVGRRTPGFSGADLANLLNEAAIHAARGHRTTIQADDVESALQTIVLGRARESALVTERDREVTAWHEAGHATAALILEDSQDPVQVTIVPRGPAGGVTWTAGRDELLHTADEMRAQLVVLLSGRAGEQLALDGQFTQGASSDLQRATEIATQMVCAWGMGSNSLAWIDLEADRLPDDARLEVASLVDEAHRKATALLEEHRDLHTAIYDALIEDETIGEEQLAALRDAHGPVPAKVRRVVTPVAAPMAAPRLPSRATRRVRFGTSRRARLGASVIEMMARFRKTPAA